MITFFETNYLDEVTQLVALLTVIFLLWCFRASKSLPSNQMTIRSVGRKSPSTGFDNIPSLIWTYWHDENPPLVVQLCLENWKRFNPDYQITMVTAATIGQYIDDVPSNLGTLHVTKQSDWLRLALLQKYGGVWLDASIILTEPLDNWLVPILNSSQSSFFAFHLERYNVDKRYPLIENWFLAAKVDDPFIRDWISVFRTKVIDEGTENYIHGLEKANLLSQYAQRVGSPYYHTMHIVAQQLIQQPGAESNYYLILGKAEDSAFKLQANSGWRRLRLFWRLLILRDKNLPPLIKLRGGERRKLEWYLSRRLYLKTSTIAYYLMMTIRCTKK